MRKDTSGSDMAPSGFFLMRTPLLPLARLLLWSGTLKVSGAPLESLQQAAAEDRDALLSRLRGIVQRPEIREALMLASAELDAAMERWLSREGAAPDEKLVLSLVRYLTRMTSRATPYGFFAGVSLGRLAASTRLAVAPPSACRKSLSLDWGYLDRIVSRLSHSPEVREALTYYPNSTLHMREDGYAYLETRSDPGSEARSDHLVCAEKSPALQRVLEVAARGATPTELTDALLASNPEVDPASAREFLHALIDNQVLESSLTPALTGAPPLGTLLEVLERVPEAAPWARNLEEVRRELRCLEREPLGSETRRYREVAERVLPLGGPCAIQNLFKAELARPGSASIGPRAVHEMRRAAELFQATATSTAPRVLEDFRARFLERYGTREVALLDALDEETGIGFDLPGSRASDPAPLLAGVEFPAAPEAAAEPTSPRARILLDLVYAALRRGDLELRLSPDDVEALRRAGPALELPAAFSVMATLLARSSEAVDQGDFQLLLHGIAGPGGLSMVTRFAQSDSDLASLARDHLRGEQATQPHRVLAEVVYTPDAREANIAQRPVLREYEIPIRGRSGAPPDRQIPPSDLLVSLQGERIVLRSARLGKEVAPRLETAHRYSNSSSSVYRFLAALGRQDGSSGVWKWTSPLAELPFLPRVSSGRVILRRAQWRLGERELAALRGKSGVELLAVLRSLRETRGLPRWVCVEVGENPVAVDLDNILSVESLRRLMEGATALVCTECLPGPDQLVVESGEGALAHEVIVPFLRREPRPAIGLPARARSAAPRRFPPGSAWLTAKIYANSAAIDGLLSAVVSPLVQRCYAEEAIAGWFFLRYWDPLPHLRLRLRGDARRLTAQILPELTERLAPFLEAERVWKLVLDTYDREVERYGGDAGLQIAEAIFEHDSNAALQVLACLEASSHPEDARWRLGLLGAHLLLCDLGLDPAARLDLTKRLREGFAREHRVDALCQRSLGRRFRGERESLERLLSSRPAGDGGAEAAFAARSKKLRALAERLAGLERAGELSVPLSEIAGSLVHMSLNRLLPSEQRRHEVVLYDFLWRLYDSQRARRFRAADAAEAVA